MILQLCVMHLIRSDRRHTELGHYHFKLDSRQRPETNKEKERLSIPENLWKVGYPTTTTTPPFESLYVPIWSIITRAIFSLFLGYEKRYASIPCPIPLASLSYYTSIFSSVWFWSLRQFVWTEQTMSIFRYFGVLSYYLNVTAAIGANNETAKCRSA